MEKMVASNQTKLDANANMHSQDNALTQKVIQNNKTIASASDSLNNIKNGINSRRPISMLTIKINLVTAFSDS